MDAMIVVRPHLRAFVPSCEQIISHKGTKPVLSNAAGGVEGARRRKKFR
jgi:hypothetical protein